MNRLTEADIDAALRYFAEKADLTVDEFKRAVNVMREHAPKDWDRFCDAVISFWHDKRRN